LGMIMWGTLAIVYSNIPSASLRTTLSWAFALGSTSLLLFFRPRRRAVGIFLAGFAGLLLWWFSIPPSQDHDWQPDVAVLPYATFAGDAVTIHNIRNNDYRSETDYTTRYYDETFDLSKLRTSDLFISFWDSPYIAHTIMSFGFGNNDYVAISIETRKSKDEDYSAIKGFFKQYELIYIVSDEHDVVRLRTNYRGENVYLYRLNAQPELVRSVFLDYFNYINHLKEQPEWYNALTHNCTTAIRGHVVPHVITRRWPSWKLLVNGYLDERLYETKVVDQSLPFPELKAHSRVESKTFTSAEEFLRSVSLNTHGCLVLDIQMPGMNGLELQRELARAHILLPIIFIIGEWKERKYGDQTAEIAGELALHFTEGRDYLRVVRYHH
jgi:CheY-like chemotaxis protein